VVFFSFFLANAILRLLFDNGPSLLPFMLVYISKQAEVYFKDVWLNGRVFPSYYTLDD